MRGSLLSQGGQLSSLESASLESLGMSPLFRPDTSTQPSTLGKPSGPWQQISAPSFRPEVHWAALRGPPSLGLCPLRCGSRSDSWALTLHVPPPSSGLSWGHSVSGRKGCRFAAHKTPPKRARGPVLPRSQCCGCSRATSSCTRRADPADRPGARDTSRTLTSPGALVRWIAVPPRSASSRQRVRPRRPHWPRAPQPAIGPRSLFYIDRSGPIGARRLLIMHAGRQSASAGAGPPRAVAKLGLLNCYYRGGPIGTELRICQHSRPGPRRSASSHWPRPGLEPAPGPGAPASIGCVGRRSPYVSI